MDLNETGISLLSLCARRFAQFEVLFTSADAFIFTIVFKKTDFFFVILYMFH